MDTQKLAIADLSQYGKNARRGNVDAIAESLQINGQYKPIVVNIGTHTGRPHEILVGNHTTRAAELLGWEEVDAVLVDVTEDVARRIVLADNRTSDLADYDEKLLAGLLKDSESLEGTGFTDDDLDLLVRSLGDLGRNEAGYIDKPTDAAEEWVGMPEFDMADQSPAKQILVSFRTLDDYVQFAEMIEQPEISTKTRSVWFPKSEIDSTVNVAYSTADDVEEIPETRPEA